MPTLNASALRKAQRALIDSSETTVEQAYHASFADIRAGVDMPELVRALQNQNTEAAIAALNIEPTAFLPLRATLIAVYEASGRQVIRAMPVLEKAGG